jgi:hypothetical protein
MSSAEALTSHDHERLDTLQPQLQAKSTSFALTYCLRVPLILDYAPSYEMHFRFPIDSFNDFPSLSTSSQVSMLVIRYGQR